MEKKKNNTAYVISQCVAYIAIGGLCYWIGKNTEKQKWNDVLNYMARSGVTMSNVVDGKEYLCSVTEITK
jgi:high-affinity Fe2+/Pb2+ permease